MFDNHFCEEIRKFSSIYKRYTTILNDKWSRKEAYYYSTFENKFKLL